ncbi:MAG: leucine-rich repeat protein [Bacteroidaceae bacterium]|nr:leucine-rich repeat protein [Bacteroidaceae bacterium]
MTYLSANAFNECISLNSVTAENLISIKESAFRSCTSLTSINLPVVREIGSNAFDGCAALTTIAWSTQLSSIGSYAFRNCPLTLLSFRNSNLQIGDYAFYGTSINQIDCKYTGNYVIPMNYNAFEDDSKSSITVNVPIGMKDIYAHTYGWDGMTIVDGTIKINVSLNKVAEVPPYVYGYIDDNYSTRSTYVSYQKENIIVGKEDWTLYVPEMNLLSLKMDSVEIKDNTAYKIPYPSVSHGIYYAGYHFSNLSNEEVSFTIDYDTPIPNYNYILFADPAVKDICVVNWDTDGDGELSTEEAAAVTSLNQKFRNKAIVSFDELRYFTGLTSLENDFWYCHSLERVTLPDSLTVIGENSFRQCEKLTCIHLPDTLERIGENAFEGCSSLKTLFIPKGLTFMATTAFKNCPSLISLSVDEANEKYDSREGCNAIITSSVGGQVLWKGCKYTRIPDTATRIGYDAFSGCTGLETIELHSGIYAILGNSFQGCSDLRRVRSYIETPFTFGGNSFQGISDDCVLIVPVGTRDAYLAAGWTEDVFKGGVMEYASDDNLSTYTYTGTEAGGFYTEMLAYDDDQLKAIKRLTVNSPINSADLFMIRKLCGDYANDPTGYADYGLEMLDLTNATIVADYGTGTVPYSASLYIRNNDELPENMLSQCKNLAEVKLPSSASLTASANIFQGAKADMIVHAPWADAPALTILPFADPLCAAFGQKSSTAVAGMTLVVPQGSLTAYEAAEGWNWFNEIREETETASGSGSGSDSGSTPTTLNGDIDGDGRVSIADVTRLVNIVLGK